MPLVFGFAPVVNTFTTVTVEGTLRFVTTPFFISLGLVIFGAVTVLLNAPKPGKKPEPAKGEKSETAEADKPAAPAETT